MEYFEFIKMINSQKIKYVLFEIKDYAHYRNCSIENTVLPNSNIHIIVVKLTQDNSEIIAFYYKFKENYKMFDFGRKGRYTLKQIWNKVIIKQISY